MIRLLSAEHQDNPFHHRGHVAGTCCSNKKVCSTTLRRQGRVTGTKSQHLHTHENVAGTGLKDYLQRHFPLSLTCWTSWDTSRGEKKSLPNWCCTIIKVSVHKRGHVAATYPPETWTRNIFMCVHMLWFCPCYMSPQCALYKFLFRCNMTPRVCPP